MRLNNGKGPGGEAEQRGSRQVRLNREGRPAVKSVPIFLNFTSQLKHIRIHCATGWESNNRVSELQENGINSAIRHPP